MRHTSRISSTVLTTLVLIGMSACGSTDPATRNAEGDAIACVSQSDSTITTNGELELHFCTAATHWVREDEGAIYSDKMPLTNGTATTSLSAFGSMKVLAYDANDEIIAIDKITLNGSRNGLTYNVDTSGENVVFSEVARAGWSGDADDPNVTHGEAETLIQNFNNSSAPIADWALPSTSELTPLFTSEEMVRIAGIDISGRGSAYWLSDTIDAASFGIDGTIYGVLRSTVAPGGFSYWQRVDSASTKDFARPTRNFTPGSGPVVLVDAGFSPNVSSSSSMPDITISSNSNSSISSTSEVPLPSVEPEQVTRINVISANEPVINLPSGQQVVEVTAADVQKYVADVSPSEVQAADIKFDGGDWISISLNAPTAITVPADAKSAVLRVTSKSGDVYQVPKVIARDGADAKTSSSEPRREPTVAASLSGTKADSNSSFMYIVIAICVAVLVLAAIAYRRRSAKKV